MKAIKKIYIVLIFLFACALIAGGYFLTRDRLSLQESEKQEQAIASVFPNAAKYTDAEYNKHFLREYLADNGIEYTDVIVSKVVYAKDEIGVVKGLIVFEECYKKYGGIITMAVGIQNNGMVNGYYIFNISEAKNLDLKVRDDEFQNQFIGKIVPFFVLTDEAAQAENEISSARGGYDASNTIVNGVNASIYTLTFIDESMGGLLG